MAHGLRGFSPWWARLKPLSIEGDTVSRMVQCSSCGSQRDYGRRRGGEEEEEEE